MFWERETKLFQFYFIFSSLPDFCLQNLILAMSCFPDILKIVQIFNFRISFWEKKIASRFKKTWRAMAGLFEKNKKKKKK